MKYVYQYMLDDLLSHHLVVRKVRGERGGFVRQVESQNPVWYRALCLQYPSSRRRKKSLPDTKIRRRNILRLLRKLVDGIPIASKYAHDLQEIAESLIWEGEELAEFNTDATILDEKSLMKKWGAFYVYGETE